MTAIAPRHLLLLLFITFLWGVNLVVSRIGLGEIPPLLFSGMRFAILALLLVPFLRVIPGQMSALLVAAVLSGAICFALMFVGLAMTSNVSAVAIAGQLGVPFTTLLSVALLGEVVRWRRWLGIGLSFGGVMLMGFDPQVLGYLASVGFVVASAFVGALGLIAVKRLRGFKPLEIQAWFAWISAPPLLAMSLLFEHTDVTSLQSVSLAGWGSVLFTAIAASLIAHTGFYYLIQRYPVTSVAPLTVLSPVFSVAMSVWLLGEVLTPRLAMGGVLTLVGVVIITLRERRIVDTGS